jgi:hypothetical protein
MGLTKISKVYEGENNYDHQKVAVSVLISQFTDFELNCSKSKKNWESSTMMKRQTLKIMPWSTDP